MTSTYQNLPKELVDKATGLEEFSSILVVVVGAPVVEEIFYRGLTLKAFEKMGGRLALVASSLLFAVAIAVRQFQLCSYSVS